METPILHKISRLILGSLALALSCLGGPHVSFCLAGQQAATPPAAAVLKPGDNLVIENIPPIPLAIAEETARYGESRSASLFDWHPTRRELLIGTRFGDTVQVHNVAMPDGARRQMTFFPDRVNSAAYLPDGNSFIFQKDIGGAEWFQIYRFDIATGNVTLLTDGKSRNETYLLAHHSTTLAYNSTQRNNKDTDIWIMDSADPKSAHMLLQVDGGGWAPLAWSLDNKQLLVEQFISVNESYLWLVNPVTGEKRLLTPKKSGSPVSYSGGAFSKDGKSIYVVTDQDNEFARLARFDLATMAPTFLTSTVPWDVENFVASENGESIAFATNENGYSKVYLLDTKTKACPLASSARCVSIPTARMSPSPSAPPNPPSTVTPSTSAQEKSSAGPKVKPAVSIPQRLSNRSWSNGRASTAAKSPVSFRCPTRRSFPASVPSSSLYTAALKARCVPPISASPTTSSVNLASQ